VQSLIGKALSKCCQEKASPCTERTEGETAVGDEPAQSNQVPGSMRILVYFGAGGGYTVAMKSLARIPSVPGPAYFEAL